MYDDLEIRARQQISERIARASEPRLPRSDSRDHHPGVQHRRHRLAEQLRRVTDRLDT